MCKATHTANRLLIPRPKRLNGRLTRAIMDWDKDTFADFTVSQRHTVQIRIHLTILRQSTIRTVAKQMLDLTRPRTRQPPAAWERFISRV